MKKLPIGIQTFTKIIEEDYLYIDKTKYFHELLNGVYYFLSRPRRFGKSLTISTLEQIFLGNKELFKGLWIYDKIEWEKYPVIRFDFSKMGYKTVGLQTALVERLKEIGSQYEIKFYHKDYQNMFRELIEKLSGKYNTVAILIDEYDKPIIDYIEDIPKAEEHRDILKAFYSVIKGSDEFIRFCFLTGVSKFSKVSIFSDLNNLTDITATEIYSGICGITQNELEYYFTEFIQLLKEKYNDIPDIHQLIKEMYNGYSWDGIVRVYNPFSILNLFLHFKFDNYWFATGTPTFLMKLLKSNQYTPLDLTDLTVDSTILDKFEISSINPIGLLFQTGYLTIKEYDMYRYLYKLDFPNLEVESSFAKHLLSEFTEKKIDKTGILIYELEKAFKNNSIEKVISIIKTLFANITYMNIDDKEKYYHSIFYVALKLLGYNIESEIMTIDGRIDAVIQTNTHTYIIEFKIGDAKTALQQIKTKNYAQKYLAQNKQIILLGIGFDVENKCVDEYEMEELK